MKCWIFFWFGFSVLLLAGSCRKPYEPEVLQRDYRFLVVNGVVNVASGGQTHINLSRTKGLQDTVIIVPEPGAQVSIETDNGQIYSVPSVNDLGDYQSAPLYLSPNGRYRLNIETSDGRVYRSAFVEPLITPPIDSVTWKQPGDLTIYVNSHDPTGNARFFRWDYVETWEYHAQLETPWTVIGDKVYIADNSNQGNYCWTGQFSSMIILGNSAALSEAVISEQPLLTIPNPDVRLNWKYSILVNQYALTTEAYHYWQIVEKNSQELGTLFDQLPSNLNGNLESLTDANEPVLGYISATAVESKRILIDRRELNDWSQVLPADECNKLAIDYNPLAYPQWDYTDPTVTLWYFMTGGGAWVAKKSCLDCRLQGGTNQKPSYW
ncbi:DUF4249 domain-containing protein [Flavihumibacter petaseus]|uniref:DUF4249 domain-containing protein n=1 Tax=Flavihumibacter petaseus NBRC 106054 TaxID=1220578 RepID=A0A0E9MW42_9BACT|nr:DUF4249 domain-containing protein [Flavihumibacter petaseus]GAO41345.1 hypothetical protein FPE01S_01_03570 [Flavihumibacter petaseus NBRC 106054]